MATGNAKQKAYFAREDRLARERAADALKAEQAGKAATVRAEQSRRDLNRRAELRQQKERERAERRKADQVKRQFNRDVEAKRAEAARIEKARAEAERKTAARQERTRRQADLRKADQTRREFNRDVDAKRAAAARTLRAERQATREVRQDQNRAREATQFRQRQETNELRSQHRIKRKGIASAIEQHEADYARQIEKIDLREQKALAAFDDRRGSLRGRIEELRQGKDAIEEQRRALQEGFQQERIATTRQLERVKDKEFEQEYSRPIEQARERMDMMQRHAAEQASQAQQHEQARPGAVAERTEAIERSHEQAQEQHREITGERTSSLSREFSMSGP